MLTNNLQTPLRNLRTIANLPREKTLHVKGDLLCMERRTLDWLVRNLNGDGRMEILSAISMTLERVTEIVEAYNVFDRAKLDEDSIEMITKHVQDVNHLLELFPTGMGHLRIFKRYVDDPDFESTLITVLEKGLLLKRKCEKYLENQVA